MIFTGYGSRRTNDSREFARCEVINVVEGCVVCSNETMGGKARSLSTLIHIMKKQRPRCLFFPSASYTKRGQRLKIVSPSKCINNQHHNVRYL